MESKFFKESQSDEIQKKLITKKSLTLVNRM